jgi:hypothetical protein
MSEDEIRDSERERSPYLLRAFSFLKTLDLRSAHLCLEDALAQDFEDSEGVFA